MTEPFITRRPGFLLGILFSLCLLIDGIAGVGLGVLGYEAAQYDGIGKDMTLLGGVILLLLAFVAASVALWRRGRRGWAVALAMIPAILTVAAMILGALLAASLGHHH